MRILLTGGTGLLGKNLKLEADRPTHQELDITAMEWGAKKLGEYDLIVHCAAYTNTTLAETARQRCFAVNVTGTLNLLNAYPHTPFVYISSEYAHKPVNFYSWTKKWAEELVALHPPYLIIRTLFKPYPYPFERAFIDQFTQGDTVDKIAPLIEKEILSWNRESKTCYVGTGRKSLFELAKASKPEVLPNNIADWSRVTGINYPSDYV